SQELPRTGSPELVFGGLILTLRLFVVVFLSVVSILFCIQPAGAQAPTMYLPGLEAVDGTELGLALLNSGSGDAQVTITARTYDGAIIGGTAVVNPYTLVVPASGKAELRLSDLLGSGISQQHGWLEIDPSTPDVKAFSFVYDASLSFVEGVDVSSGTSNQIVF